MGQRTRVRGGEHVCMRVQRWANTWQQSQGSQQLDKPWAGVGEDRRAPSLAQFFCKAAPEPLRASLPGSGHRHGMKY